MDYSNVTIISSLGLAVKKKRNSFNAFYRLTDMVLNRDILILIVVAVVLALTCGAAIQLIERRHDGGTRFPKEYRHNAWWAAQTLVAHNCGNKLPHSERGRHIALLLMLGGTILTAQLTALMTTNLSSVVAESAPITQIGDVGRHRVAVMNDSYAQQWSQQNFIHTKSYRTIKDCLEAVQKGEVAAAICDEGKIKHLLTQDSSLDLKLTGPAFGAHQYAFILKKNSPYFAAVNSGIDSLFESGRMSEMNKKWMLLPIDDGNG